MLRSTILLGALLTLSVSNAMAQAGPVISSVVFKANSPHSVVATSTSGSGVITAGCVGFTIGVATVDRTCAANVPIGGRISPSTVAFISMNGKSTGFYYTNTAPANGCQNVTTNIFYGASMTPVFTGCAASLKFTLTISKDGSIGLTQN